MKSGERETPMRRNAYSLAVRNAEEEAWVPVIYYDKRVSLAREEVFLTRSFNAFCCLRRHKRIECTRVCMPPKSRSSRLLVHEKSTWKV